MTGAILELPHRLPHPRQTKPTHGRASQGDRGRRPHLHEGSRCEDPQSQSGAQGGRGTHARSRRLSRTERAQGPSKDRHHRRKRHLVGTAVAAVRHWKRARRAEPHAATPAPHHRERLREAVESAAKIYLEAGAREVLVPTVPALVIRAAREATQARQLAFAPATAPMLSAHQQGTVRFAASERDGGADLDSQVYGTRDVYDSSGFSSSASSHTMTPIIASSRMLTTKLLTRI